MTRIGVGVVAMVLCAGAAGAQDFGRYRTFDLGIDVAAVSALTGGAGSDLKVIHQRPALIQELTWRPRYSLRRAEAPDIQSVDQMVFAFHDNRLFRVTVEYDQTQTEGLSDGDMIEAVSAIYGTPLLRTVTQGAAASGYGDPGTLIAQWGGVENTVRLYRPSSYATRFRMVVTAEPLAALARRDAARALALDTSEAPQREADRVKKEAEDRRTAEEKARTANRATFRP